MLPPAQAGFGFLRDVWPSPVGDKELHCIDQTQLMDAGFIPGDLLSPHCRAAEGLQEPVTSAAQGHIPGIQQAPMGSATTSSVALFDL